MRIFLYIYLKIRIHVRPMKIRNGQKTKFQLVPIDEINELREKVGLPVSKFSYKGEAKSVG